MKKALFILLLTGSAFCGPLRQGFSRPPDDTRVMMRWWWFGPAVTKPELEREMRLMKEGGIGGFEVQPVYPLELDDPGRGFRNLPFLSEEFIDALRFTADKARELGLRMDLTLGSGWPFGGPGVPISQASARLRCDRIPVPAGAREVALPQTGDGEKLIAAFVIDGKPAEFPAGGEARELTQLRQGAVSLPEGGPGPRTVLVFISSRTRQMVKRAAAGAEGFVLDHYDRGALDAYLKNVGEPLFRAFQGTKPPYAVFCDSLEVYGADWTPDFLEEFQKRRGYDLKPHLPALAGDTGPRTGAVRNDWIRTLSELAEERFLVPLRDWTKARGSLLRVQDYGIPPVTLASNGVVDLAEGEGSFWNRFTTSRWASSASHLFGRPVTSSETWTWLHSPAFRATPLDMKAEADRHFLQGINQLIGHGWPYSPENAGKPGWRFYASAVFNNSNPWWIVMPEVTGYLQRMSYLLRQGAPVNDVALYLPASDARAAMPSGRPSINEGAARILGPDLVSRILEAGFGFDLIDDSVLNQHGRVEKGALAVNGNRYQVVILPAVERIPLETYRKLEQFTRGGGLLLATRRAPSLAPGLMEAARETPEIAAISRRLFEGASAPAHLAAGPDGLKRKLETLRTPDVAMSPAAPAVGFVHRSSSEGEIYFLANTSNAACRTRATFRVRGMEPEWWDPFTGGVEPAKVAARLGGRVTVALALEPYESRVLVFSKSGVRPAGGERRRPAAPPPVDLSSAWKLTFNDSGRTVQAANLRSWTEDAETRFYSGTATYEKTVTVGNGMLAPGLTVWLDFGEGTAVPETGRRQQGMRAWLEAPVREAAVVYINGQKAGSVWRPPYRVEVGRLLRPGENALRIVVGNLAINTLAGSPPPDYGPLNRRYGQRFSPQDMDDLKPVPAGILGPVRLVAR